MSHPEPHRPNVIGCAFGFAWIGAGAGVVPGFALGKHQGMFVGIAIGYVLGAIAGTVYALLVGRTIDKQSRASSEAE
jgi:hypothetical protein